MDCAISLPSVNRLYGPTETLSNFAGDEREQIMNTFQDASNFKDLYNRAGVSTKTVLGSHGVLQPKFPYEKKSNSQTTYPYSYPEKMSRASNTCSDLNQTEITKPANSTESGQKPSSNENVKVRNGASLSFDDLEDDTIYGIDCKTKVLQTVPDSIPNDLPRIKLEKGGGRGCFFKVCVSVYVTNRISHPYHFD